MIVALLVLLGVPLWLVLGLLLAVFLSRRRFRQRPDAFRLKARLLSGEFPGLTTTFPRTTADAVWVQDVLAIFHGTARLRVLLLPTLAVNASTTTLPDVKGIGSDPYGVTVRLEDGALVQIAAPHDASPLVTGPYETPVSET